MDKQEILKIYIEQIAPMMVKYENMTNEFPVGVFNELRAVFFHFAKYELLQDDVDKQKEIEKASNHTKRAMRDCYKYICVAYETLYNRFGEMFKNRTDILTKGDVSLIKKIERSHVEAVEKLNNARTQEFLPDSSKKDEFTFEAYKKAEIEYENLYNLIKTFFQI